MIYQNGLRNKYEENVTLVRGYCNECGHKHIENELDMICPEESKIGLFITPQIIKQVIYVIRFMCHLVYMIYSF